MRFHIGFSKRISKKTIVFLLGLLSLAFAMFFGNTEIVFADTRDFQPTITYYNNTSTPSTPSVVSSTYDYYWNISNIGSNSFDFTLRYDFSSACPSGSRAQLVGKITLYFNGYFYPNNNNFQTLYTTGGSIYGTTLSTDGNFSVLTLNNVDISKPVKIIANTSRSDTVTRVYVSRTWTVTCIADGTGQIIDNQNQNTQDIINNQNQNTQDVIDNQNDSNTSGSQTTASSFLNNFHFNDTTGLTGVITAPIRLLQGIINSNDSCSDYSFSISILGTQTKNVTLPSGCILWNNVPQAVIVTYWVVVWAIVGYRCLVDMYHFASSLRDPDKKNDFTLDL